MDPQRLLEQYLKPPLKLLLREPKRFLCLGRVHEGTKEDIAKLPSSNGEHAKHCEPGLSRVLRKRDYVEVRKKLSWVDCLLRTDFCNAQMHWARSDRSSALWRRSFIPIATYLCVVSFTFPSANPLVSCANVGNPQSLTTPLSSSNPLAERSPADALSFLGSCCASGAFSRGAG